MGVLDKIKAKIKPDKHQDGTPEAHEDEVIHPSINVPLQPDDAFCTTGLFTNDPLKDWRYTVEGLKTATQTPDQDGLIQGMEHLAVAGKTREPGGLLRGMNPPLSIKCGPLLRFISIDYQAEPTWLGSVMIVTIDAESDYTARPTMKLNNGETIPGEVLHTQFGASFWRFNLKLSLAEQGQQVQYSINGSDAIPFSIPSKHETMNMMFHSCNGFSLSVDQTKFCGPDPLWKDVLRAHVEKPFHVMLGGGDQIYCDLVSRRCALFKQWLNMSVMEHKTAKPFTADMEHELEAFYFEHYCWWFRQGEFGRANGMIPMVNIFDDHDIIDGFGSYPDHFMSSPVFSGLGNVAFKHYCLFQHQTLPTEEESSNIAWTYGVERGPYIREHSRNIISNFGPKTVFFGFDNRTERTKHTIVTPETYDKCFNRLSQQIVRGKTEHLIVLLGVPIAYPRLVWLEELLTSKAMNPLKVLGKTGVLSGFTQKFDEGVEILDDLNDHWTAKHHKEERNAFVHRLQALALSHSVRITLLGGDVHCSSFGAFYSNPALNIPREKDHRFIANVISSAIVNTPPAETVTNVLGKRNKVHHLDDKCDEYNLPIFTEDVNGKKLNNQALLPRRNWCSMNHDQTKDGQLIVNINVEIDQTNPEGRTKAYPYFIPKLTV